jgi:hypothetical protein
MSFDVSTLITLAWLLGGVALVVSEVFLPGLIAVFLGVAALLVAGLRGLGLVESMVASTGLWLLGSGFLVLGLRSTLRRYFPAESHRDNVNEELSAFGSIVEVIEACDDENLLGRIRFQGTTWPVRSLDGRIEAGARARVVCRDKQGLGWVIEPVPALEEDTDNNS